MLTKTWPPMMIVRWLNVFLLSSLATLAQASITGVRADDPMTAREFLAMCDRIDPNCRNEYVAGLQAAYEAKLACPPRIDVNSPITPWLDEMHRLVKDKPNLADEDKNRLQLWALMRLWPCPKN